MYTISKFEEFQTEFTDKIYCEFVNSMGCEYIVREVFKVGEGKKKTFLKSILKKIFKKIRVKSVVIFQYFNLEEFFASMPLKS